MEAKLSPKSTESPLPPTYWPEDGSNLTTCVRCRRWIPRHESSLVITRIKKAREVITQRVGVLCRYCLGMIEAGGRVE